MKQIRQGVFETNSSSTHSVTIYGSDHIVYPKYIPVIEFGEFGWEQNLYPDYTDKLSYVITMLATRYGIDKLEDFLELKEFRWLKEAVESHCGQVLEVKVQDTDWSPLGYVDHQSNDVLDDFLVPEELEFKVKVLDFVFNEKYAFETDNDNH
jgi:hypothetical protein